jgi:hypothetical protein
MLYNDVVKTLNSYPVAETGNFYNYLGSAAQALGNTASEAVITGTNLSGSTRYFIKQASQRELSFYTPGSELVLAAGTHYAAAHGEDDGRLGLEGGSSRYFRDNRTTNEDDRVKILGAEAFALVDTRRYELPSGSPHADQSLTLRLSFGNPTNPQTHKEDVTIMRSPGSRPMAISSYLLEAMGVGTEISPREAFLVASRRRPRDIQGVSETEQAIILSAFSRARSDIDLLALVQQAMSHTTYRSESESFGRDLEQLKQLRAQLQIPQHAYPALTHRSR